jgi:hypothetical protein
MEMAKRNGTLSIVLGTVLFGVGVILGQRIMFRAFGVQLRGVQATLGFDRIVQERAIKSLLARGTRDAVNSAILEVLTSQQK